jgi:hypothetical protein
LSTTHVLSPSGIAALDYGRFSAESFFLTCIYIDVWGMVMIGSPTSRPIRWARMGLDVHVTCGGPGTKDKHTFTVMLVVSKDELNQIKNCSTDLLDFVDSLRRFCEFTNSLGVNNTYPTGDWRREN